MKLRVRRRASGEHPRGNQVVLQLQPLVVFPGLVDDLRTGQRLSDCERLALRTPGGAGASAMLREAQTVLDGRVVVAGPRQRNHPDFPLRGFVRCEICGRPLTGSWSKGRNGHYAYYHCQRQCRAVNVSKAGLESAFADELALLQPTPGYMRLVKDRILHVWEQRRAEANDRTVAQQRRVSAIQQKMDKLDEAFL
jgi:hypothetical protein